MAELKPTMMTSPMKRAIMTGPIIDLGVLLCEFVVSSATWAGGGGEGGEEAVKERRKQREGGGKGRFRVSRLY